MHVSQKANSVLAIGAICYLVGTKPASAQFFQNSVGLSNPAQTITFDEVALAPNTAVTTQYASYGVTFSGLFYDPVTPVSPNINGNFLANFLPDVPATNPFSINFTTPVTQDAVVIATPTGSTEVQALLNGVIVSDQTVSTSLANPDNYFGSQGVAFNQLRINSLTAFDRTASIDNLQFGAVTVPEPGALPLLGLGFSGLALAARRRRRLA